MKGKEEQERKKEEGGKERKKRMDGKESKRWRGCGERKKRMKRRKEKIWNTTESGWPVWNISNFSLQLISHLSLRWSKQDHVHVRSHGDFRSHLSRLVPHIWPQEQPPGCREATLDSLDHLVKMFHPETRHESCFSFRSNQQGRAAKVGRGQSESWRSWRGLMSESLIKWRQTMRFSVVSSGRWRVGQWWFRQSRTLKLCFEFSVPKEILTTFSIFIFHYCSHFSLIFFSCSHSCCSLIHSDLVFHGVWILCSLTHFACVKGSSHSFRVSQSFMCLNCILVFILCWFFLFGSSFHFGRLLSFFLFFS